MRNLTAKLFCNNERIQFMSQPQLKHGINPSSIAQLAASINDIEADFSATKFKRLALKGLDALELKDRVYHIIAALHQTLPNDFRQSAKLLTELKKNWASNNKEDRYGFTAWAITDYVGVHGLEYPKQSLRLLQHLTSLFSAEFAIRPFIQQHPKSTWICLHQWAEHKEDSVRRLASEGCRPRLPWGAQLPELIKFPMPIIALLTKLKDDESEYVRRSVANNLNDISKDHPDLVIKVCKRWSKGASEECQWIIRHATRSLVKQGHPDVFALLGYTENPKVSVDDIKLSSAAINLGETLEFSAELNSTTKAEQKLIVDYAIHYVKANGTTSAKVYKLKNIQLKPKEKLLIKKRQAFKPISTRVFYAGEHSLEILVNGKAVANKIFCLKL